MSSKYVGRQRRGAVNAPRFRVAWPVIGGNAGRTRCQRIFPHRIHHVGKRFGPLAQEIVETAKKAQVGDGKPTGDVYTAAGQAADMNIEQS